MAFIFGIAGACRREELAHLKVDNIEDLGHLLLIKIPDNKTNKPRSFTVTGEFLDYYRRYVLLRPTQGLTFSESRFFLRYCNGKCCKQVVGIHKFGSIPKEIATFLKLSNAEDYTGHCFRRTSATLLVDAGANLTSLKRHGGWRSSTVAESYIDDSIVNKVHVANQILGTKQQLSNGDVCSSSVAVETMTNMQTDVSAGTQIITGIENVSTSSSIDFLNNSSANRAIVFQSCTNCTFNIINKNN